MSFIKYIKYKSKEFSDQGFLGSLVAIGFLLLMFIALTSPFWLLVLGIYFVGNIIH